MATEGLNSKAPSIDAAREFYQTYTLPRKCIVSASHSFTTLLFLIC